MKLLWTSVASMALMAFAAAADLRLPFSSTRAMATADQDAGVARSAGPGARTPVLVELFTSEGCSSCPPADTLLSRLVALQPIPNVEVIALGFHVDYWDRLGWKDQFSSAAYTARQNAYADAWRSDKVYTPQAVVDGAHEFIGSDAEAARRVITDAAKTPKLAVTVERAPDAAAAADRAAIRTTIAPAADKALKTDVLIAITQDGLSTNVQRGENAKRLLSHAAVVRSLERIGSFNGRDAFTTTRQVSLNPAWPRATLKAVVIVQDTRSKRIVGLASCTL